MAFQLNLDDRQVETIKRERQFVAECHAASDIDLGRTILSLAQQVRTAYREQFGAVVADLAMVVGRDMSSEFAADGMKVGPLREVPLVWEIAPEIARRLGVHDFARGKRSYAMRRESPLLLRIWTADSIFGSRHMLAPASIVPGPADEAWALLTREPAIGNPIAIALDRVAAPTEDNTDTLARRMAEISVTRGFSRQLGWSPAMDWEPAVFTCPTEDDDEIALPSP